MKAYLVLDLTVHDFGSFREYIEKVPAFIRKHGGGTSYRARSPRLWRATGSRSEW